MDYTDIRFDLEAGVATLTLHRPEAMNSFSGRMGAELSDAYRRCDEDDTVAAQPLRVQLLHEAARRVWDDAYEMGQRHGYRNAQVTVIAPTGTIGFMLDCDTTGVEPELALVKYKNLVGGVGGSAGCPSAPRLMAYKYCDPFWRSHLP